MIASLLGTVSATTRRSEWVELHVLAVELPDEAAA
jgi:hypothetical protein